MLQEMRRIHRAHMPADSQDWMLPCSQMSGGYTPQKAYDAVPQLHLETNKDAVVGWSGLRRHQLTAIASSKSRQWKAAGHAHPRRPWRTPW